MLKTHPNLPSSARLVFRLWTDEDLPLATSLWTDPDVMRYMGGPMSDKGVRARLDLEMSWQSRSGVQYWPMFLRQTGQFTGCAGLRPWHDEPHVFEVGVHVARLFWSERLGTEAARAAMRYGFEELDASALTMGHGPGNVRSQAMIERLGFRYTHEEPWGPENVLHPSYRIERAEFLTLRL